MKFQETFSWLLVFTLFQSQPQITPLMGFDRLREAGFTEEDIRNIRTQFHHLHGTTFDGGKELKLLLLWHVNCSLFCYCREHRTD